MQTVQVPRFALDSGQCELLLAFEMAESLAELSRLIGRDSSVISRQLSRLAETAPVLVKQRGRWRLTELGRHLNRWTRASQSAQARLLQQHAVLRFSSSALPTLPERAALLLVGVQKGFDDPIWGKRNNPGAEHEIARLLAHWRERKRPIFHIQHMSKRRDSPLCDGSVGAKFKETAAPRGGEPVIKKSVNSGFVGTALEKQLRAAGVDTVVIAGLSTNHCVDATARTASDLGFTVYVVADATVAFDRVGPDGRRVAAEEVQSVVLANLNQEFAMVVESEELLRPPTLIDVRA